MATVQVSVQPEITFSEPGALPKTDRNVEEFRNYKDSTYQERVERTYRLMHTNQTVDFVKNRLAFWKTFNHAEITIMEACDLLNELIDETDPDLGVPNAIHAFQTAEKIREAHPDKDWFHLTGFIHDLGKVMAMWGEEQWATCGDTYPVGCRPSEHVAFGLESFKDNPDMKHDVFRDFRTEFGADGNINAILNNQSYSMRYLLSNWCSEVGGRGVVESSLEVKMVCCKRQGTSMRAVRKTFPD